MAASLNTFTSLIRNLIVQTRKTSVGEESNDCFVASYRLSKHQSLPTTTLLRTPQDLENNIPPRYVTHGFKPFAKITVWQAIFKTKWCTVIGYCLVRVFYSRGCYHKSTQFHFNIFFYCSHTTGKFKLQSKKTDKFKLIWTIILTSEPNITKILMLQRDK